MLHQQQPLFSSTVVRTNTMPPRRPSQSNPNSHHHHHPYSSSSSSFAAATAAAATPCRHSPPSATLDLLILVLVLFSCTFLITSSFSYIFRSLSLLLSSSLPSSPVPLRPFLAGLLLFLALSLFVLARRRRACSRRCGNPRCRGLKKALEFDVQLQTDEAIRTGVAKNDAMWKEIDDLPYKGGQGGNNPDYECLRAELRRMAPPNGRAVLLFRSKCGCPVAKLEAWGGPKRGRRHKKGTSNLALEGVR